MATTQVNPIQTPANALRAAIARNSSNGSQPQPVAPVAVPRMTEPGTSEAKAGVSLQDQMAAMVAAAVAQALAGVAVPAATRGKQAKAPKAPKPAPIVESGPWYSRKAYLGRTEKETGKAFYDVDFDTVMATDSAAIMRSNKYSHTVLFIVGKRKPVYLSASALETLIAAFPKIREFATENAEYLERCIANPAEGNEE